MSRPTIRTRLTLWYGAALAVILVLFSVATYWRYRAAAWRAYEADLSVNLDTLQAELAEEIGEARTEIERLTPGAASPALVLQRAATSSIEEFRLSGMAAEVRLGPGAQTLLAELPGFRGRAVGSLLPAAAWERAAASTGTRVVVVPGGRAAVRSFRLPQESATITAAVGDRTTLVDGTLASIRRALVLFGTAGLLLALAGGYWLATGALRPIAVMTTQAGRMASAVAASGSHRMAVTNPDDELGRLATTFNQLLERLEASSRQIRGFVADAAHELKTPVSVVRAEAELSLSGDRSLEDSRDALRAIARQSEELSRLVSDLTLLAEGETFDVPLERRLVDLNELAQEVTRSQRALAAGRSVVVDVESTGCVEYRGDERLLRQVLKNLVENAIKFSRSPGRVGVSVSEEPRAIEVRIVDEAPTLSPADRERVFERFYRTQQSRSANVDGSGLGLAIARWAVRLHGGEIRVEPRESASAGNIFVVTFPLPAASNAA
ncbi:MAG TPA: HAMP domain-containing sensor histidine kinase [Thermoanaerobaculia bacterium]